MSKLPVDFPEPEPPEPIPNPVPTQIAPPSWLLGIWEGEGRSFTVNADGSIILVANGVTYNGIYQSDGTIFLNGDTSSVIQTSTGIQTQNLTHGGTSNYAHPASTTPPVSTTPPITTTPPTGTTQPVNTPISTTDPTTGTITTQYPDGTVTITDPKTGQTIITQQSNSIMTFIQQNPITVAIGAALIAYLILGE